MRAHGPGRDRDRQASVMDWNSQNSVQLIGSSQCWCGGWHGLPTLDSPVCGGAEFVTMYASEASCKFRSWEEEVQVCRLGNKCTWPLDGMLAKAVCVLGVRQRAARSNHSARSIWSWGFLQSSGLWFSLCLSPEPEALACQKQKHNCQSDSLLL